MDKSFTFDDILFVPFFADFEREDVNITSCLFDECYRLPIISSPMDTITDVEMADAMRKAGGLGVVHRYQDLSTLIFKSAYGHPIAVAPSMGIDVFRGLELTVFMDVAHGDTKRNIEFCRELVANRINVVSGNIVTPGAVERYLKVGVNTFRVGIGSGSVCTTRTVAGVGFPQAHAIRMLRDEFNSEITIISDGGHRTTGDIVKALALGADFVMLGGMLAGTDESIGVITQKKNISPFNNETTTYRGMASKDAVFGYKGEDDEFLEEGINKSVPLKGSVVPILKNIEKAIRLGCYYTGSRNLDELRNAEIILISDNGYKEGLTNWRG